MYGAPDHDGAFESRELKRFLQKHRVQQHISVPYRPADNGPIEQSCATLTSILRKACARDPTEWKGKLREAEFAFNTSTNNSLNFSPFEPLFGYLPKLPHQEHSVPFDMACQDRLSISQQIVNWLRIILWLPKSSEKRADNLSSAPSTHRRLCGENDAMSQEPISNR